MFLCREGPGGERFEARVCPSSPQEERVGKIVVRLVASKIRQPNIGRRQAGKSGMSSNVGGRFRQAKEELACWATDTFGILGDARPKHVHIWSMVRSSVAWRVEAGGGCGLDDAWACIVRDCARCEQQALTFDCLQKHCVSREIMTTR